MGNSGPLGNATDTWTDGRTGYTTKNYGTTAGLNLRTGSGDWRTWIYWARPFPLGATIISASIKFYTRQSWASGVVVTAQRASAAWSVNKITHANQPGVTGATASSGSLGALVAGAEVNIDVTAIMQAVATGSPWYGLRITATGAPNKSVHSAQTSSRTLQPVLTVVWSDAPDTPKQFFPDGNRAVVSGSPMLRCDFVDVSGDQAIGAMQVQVDAAANWTSPAWDSGTWPVSAPELNLADFVEILSNPTFDVDLSGGWVAGGAGTITRVTTPVHSGAGAVQLQSAAGGTSQVIASGTGVNAIPCKPNQSYTVSGWVRTAVTARAMGIVIDWYDSTGAVISTSSQGSSNDTTSYVQRTYTQTSPANAAFMRPYFNFGSLAAGEIHYVDDAHVGVTAIPFTPVALNASTFWRVRTQDGAGVWSAWSHTVNGTGAQFKRVAKPTIALTNPSPSTVQYTNYVGNPGAEVNATSGMTQIGASTWTLSQVADTSFGTGSFIGRQTCTTFTSSFGLGWLSTRIFQPGVYVFGVIIRSSVPVTIRPYYEGSATTTGNTGVNTPIAANTPTLLTANITVTAAGTLKPGWNTSTPLANGDYLEWDCLALFEGSTWPGYFDGNTADTSLVVYDWVGTANLSESTKTSIVRYVNYAVNPSAESGVVTNWGSIGAGTPSVPAAGTIPALFGTRAIQVVTTTINSGTYTPASCGVAGATYTWGPWVYSLVDTTITLSCTQSAPVGGSASMTGTSTTVVPANTWTRCNPLTGTVPAVETATNFIIKSSAIGTFYVDGMMIAQGTEFPTYFDGDYAPPGFTTGWTGTVRASNSWAASATINEPTPPISWTATSQKSWQVLVVDANKTSKVYWDSGKITSGATNTTPSTAAFSDSTKTYKIILRIWDNVDREQNGLDPVYTETSIGAVYQYLDAVLPVTGLTMTQLTDLPCAVLAWTRANAPDGWAIYRDGKLVEEKLGLGLFISGTSYKYTDCGADPRVTHTWTVIPIVNNRHSSNNPTVSGATTLRAPILMRADGTDAVALLNPDIPLVRQSNQELHDPLGNVPPVLITQSLKGNAGHAKGLIAAEGFSSGLAARTQRDRFDSMRDDSGVELRLVRADENMKVIAFNMTYDPRSVSGVVDYLCEFDFVQVDF